MTHPILFFVNICEWSMSSFEIKIGTSIEKDKSCYFKRKYIGQNIRLLQDIYLLFIIKLKATQVII